MATRAATRNPKLPLNGEERVALRRAHLAAAALAAMAPRELVAATDGAVPLARARLLCALASLQRLSGVGPSLAADLVSLGYARPEDLVGQDPDRMLARLERRAGRQDPCVGDVFHCAVWHAEHPDAPERGWWEWSQERLGRRGAERVKG